MGWRDDIAKAMIRAYHGSPHDFDKFDLNKIGTGEGAQAYGHGLYFAGNENVARGYRDSLSDLKDRKIEGTDLTLPSWVANTVASGNPMAMADMRSTFQGRLNEMKAQLADPNTMQPWVLEGNMTNMENILKALGHVEAGAKIAPAGRMYEVNINAHPDQLLDWDRPIGQGVASRLPSSLVEKAQNEAYSRVLAATDKTRADQLWSMVKDPAQAPGEFLYRQLHRESYPTRPDTRSPWQASGAASYDEALAQVGGDKSRVQTVVTPDAAYASQTLNNAGIPGIKYLDAGSRAAGEGSSNYVVFNPDLIDVVKKYGIPGAIGTGGAIGELAAPDQYEQAQ